MYQATGTWGAAHGAPCARAPRRASNAPGKLRTCWPDGALPARAGMGGRAARAREQRTTRRGAGQVIIGAIGFLMDRGALALQRRLTAPQRHGRARGQPLRRKIEFVGVTGAIEPRAPGSRSSGGYRPRTQAIGSPSRHSPAIRPSRHTCNGRSPPQRTSEMAQPWSAGPPGRRAGQTPRRGALRTAACHGSAGVGSLPANMAQHHRHHLDRLRPRRDPQRRRTGEAREEVGTITTLATIPELQIQHVKKVPAHAKEQITTLPSQAGQRQAVGGR